MKETTICVSQNKQQSNAVSDMTGDVGGGGGGGRPSTARQLYGWPARWCYVSKGGPHPVAYNWGENC